MAVEVLYPPRCMGCGELVESDFGLCNLCWRDTPFIAGTVCDACGAPVLGLSDGHRIECDDCMETPRSWRDGRSALLYKGQARKLVLALKHGDRPEIARPAGRWLARVGRPLLTDRTIVVPVPLHWTRLLRRRYNQSALLAQSFGKFVEREVIPDLLTRKQRTPMLEGKTVAQRQDILDRAISVHPRRQEMALGADVLLIDDVMTTGATLAACAQACHAAGANRIDVLTLARVAKDA